ncbi:MAG: hypothetical protein EXS35_01705 [Pedosphaera sp.]|nr:hypothetical protein [Pedosphaera sp.]
MGGLHVYDLIGDVITNTVYYAKINTNGTLGPWLTANPLPRSVDNLSAAVWKNRIYTIGGEDGATFRKEVYSSVIQPDGSLSVWVAQPQLPDGAAAQAEVANGFLYVLGGGVPGNVLTSAVYYSKINDDGTLAGWNQTTSLVDFLGNLGAVAANGRIFTIGGWQGSLPSNEFSRAY